MTNAQKNTLETLAYRYAEAITTRSFFTNTRINKQRVLNELTIYVGEVLNQSPVVDYARQLENMINNNLSSLFDVCKKMNSSYETFNKHVKTEIERAVLEWVKLIGEKLQNLN